MKSIGFIDYSIDEWHANNYPTWIRQCRSHPGFDITLAWEKTPAPGGRSLARWCSKNGIQPANSLEQVVAECDCLAVLSPDNPEAHEELSTLALASGKPVYIDKTFAPTLAAAKRMFDLAEEHGTPMFSSSALRFSPALQSALANQLVDAEVRAVSTCGPGRFANYAVHQLEILVMTLGLGATRVMQVGSTSMPTLVIDYGDDRRGMIQHIPERPFRLAASYGDDKNLLLDISDDFWTGDAGFIPSLLTFFDTGEPPVPESETLEIIGILEAGVASMGEPDTWKSVSHVNSATQ